MVAETSGSRPAHISGTAGSPRTSDAGLSHALSVTGPTDTAETLGHIAYRRRFEAATAALARGGVTERSETAD